MPTQAYPMERAPFIPPQREIPPKRAPSGVRLPFDLGLALRDDSCADATTREESHGSILDTAHWSACGRPRPLLPCRRSRLRALRQTCPPFGKLRKADGRRGLDHIRNTPALLIVDVRTSREFKDRHLRGSVNAPLFALHKLAPKLPGGRPVLVVSLQGIRSIQACKLIRRLRPDIRELAYVEGPIMPVFQPRPARRASAAR